MAAPCQAVPARGYQPRPAHNALKHIVEDYADELFGVWDERFLKEHGPLHKRARKLFADFVRCGDLHFGFLRLRCLNPDCPSKAERLVPFSCKARGLCPSCGQRRSIQWAARMVEDVLPRVPYRQLVFTIPRRLRRFFLFDRSLYGDLCRAAYAVTRDHLRQLAPAGFPERKRAVPAMVLVPQSFGDLLVHHPHVHALCSLGLFLKDGSFYSLEDADFAALEASFRERVFSFLLKKELITQEVVESMRAWQHSGFQVSWERRFEPDDRKAIEGLLSYMDRPPVSLRRLTYRATEGLVHYQGTKLHPRLGVDHQLLPPLEFLALLVGHVLLRYQVTIRACGALSTTFRKLAGWIAAPPVSEPPRAAFLPLASGAPVRAAPQPAPPQSPPPLAPRPLDDDTDASRERRYRWAKLIARTWLEDPSLCSACQKEMKVLAAISSPAHDDVIERILRSQGDWHPPWKRQRQRPARGPPARASPSQASPALDTCEPHEPGPGFGGYAVDPPGPDDGD